VASASTEEGRRPPFPWRALLSLLSELTGLLLLGFVLFLVWPPLPLALLGALMLYLPNRR
jgi:hypothetical protein